MYSRLRFVLFLVSYLPVFPFLSISSCLFSYFISQQAFRPCSLFSFIFLPPFLPFFLLSFFLPSLFLFSFFVLLFYHSLPSVNSFILRPSFQSSPLPSFIHYHLSLPFLSFILCPPPFLHCSSLPSVLHSSLPSFILHSPLLSYILVRSLPSLFFSSPHSFFPSFFVPFFLHSSSLPSFIQFSPLPSFLHSSSLPSFVPSLLI